MVPKVSQNDPKIIPKLSETYPNMIPKWSQNDPKMIPKLSQNGPKMIQQWSQNDPKMIPKWSQNDLKNNLKMIPKRSKHDPKMIPKFVYYSPGDRAQKVIPGGAKTNESFRKSKKDVEKSILRFPSLLCTIALVIERKQLSPEARKQTRASESLKITPKAQLYVSHHLCLQSRWW